MNYFTFFHIDFFMVLVGRKLVFAVRYTVRQFMNNIIAAVKYFHLFVDFFVLLFLVVAGFEGQSILFCV